MIEQANSLTLEQRITRLEERMDHQREYSMGYRGDIKEIKMTLAQLVANENRNKWLLIGIVGTFIAQQMGVVEFIKKFIL